MESLQLHRKLPPLLLLFSLFHFLSAEFSPSDNYLILCGSTTNATVDNRVFVGDSVSDSGSFLLSATSEISRRDRNPSPDSSALYNTARIFKGPASYEFNIKTTGTHMVRLHFFPFSSEDTNLSSAVFNVSAFGSLLLRDFSVPNITHVLKEYIMEVDAPKLVISFMPSGNSSSSSIAFVNAIEVFSVPDNLIADFGRYINSTGFTRYNGLKKQILESVHRINVGGPMITSFNDTLWRNWIPDDNFLRLNSSAKVVNFSGPIEYPAGGPTPEIAPDAVYNTAREMNTQILMSPRFNITWTFPVSTDFKYLVRMHFCDFVSKTVTQLYFDVFINGLSAYQDLHPSDITLQTFAAPFYIDFITDPEESGAIRVSIGPSEMSDPSKINAILNGLEIMKINNSAGSLEGVHSVKSNSMSKKMVVILIASILGGLACIGLVILWVIKGKKLPKKSKEAAAVWSPVAFGRGTSSQTRASRLTEGTVASPQRNLGLHVSFAEIKLATDNFNESYVVGSGGFGKVYKGVLRDGTKVAVKRGMPGSKQGLPEFQTEIMVLSRIRHRHLVSLIGYCQEQSEMILVYEFMEMGPLKKHLYGSDLPCLTWKQRLEICIGAAKGLHYLHTGYLQGIIHRDVKSSNILLDEDYLAKVADFGLSKLGPSLDETHVSTAVKGSFGYLDPEYYKRHQLTDKSDVYSFGVVLLEVLCARPVINTSLSREEENIVEWAMHWQKRGLLDRIVDPRLTGEINSKSLMKYWETAGKCLADYGVDRPAIGDVLWNLEYALQLHETELRREPFEDSSSHAAEHPLPTVRRAPSSSVRVNNVAEVNEEQSESTTNQVFSQLMNYEGR
ncbi:hypothetical protein MRB53_019644 [Persea americana]|uniref:Uncharacterized protein n=1 Tax=Persea americana TaxID=3435 RepID=A0ACC2KYL3_PERAE|nr:hypothetical protein MRB53_019644 [Persea americana]